MSQLVIRSLGVAFGTIGVLNNFNLTVPDGEHHALIGPNGAGKSTLLNAISGWVRPQKGEIKLNDRPIAGIPPHKIARLGVGRANQIPIGFPTLSVIEHLKMSLQAGRGGVKFSPNANEKALALGRDVQLTDALALPASQLSHGQRKRLELGCALAQRPRLLLLDEPTSGLSAAESNAMVALLQRIQTTMLVVEHDMDVVAALATRVSVLHHGQVLAQGTPERIANNLDVKSAYLGHAES